jgi:hypothetical protein
VSDLQEPPMTARAAIAVLVACSGLAIAPAGLAQERANLPAAATQRDAGHLPIERITLYRSGVGAFERRGLVDGDATIPLRFKTEQINDVIKSMMVLDLSRGKGRIDGISYGSKEPLSRRLAAFGIDISDNPAAGEILQRLRGTPVRLVLPEGAVSGTIMNVEKRPTVYAGGGEKGTVVHDLPWINLITDTGVRSINLTTVTGFEILDEELAAELSKALGALAEHRADRTKSVDVHLSGEGAREIVVAYVQEAPVWKTSYRLILPDPPKGKEPAPSAADRFTIQGWAIVENTTDDDWKDVSLALVSGRPVSFRMDLYEPLFVFRPEVPVPTVPGVMPRVYAEGRLDAPMEQVANKRMDGRARMAMPAPSAPAAAEGAEISNGFRAQGGATSDDLANYAAAAQARAVEAGEVFQYELDHPVTIERQRSAMLPILASGIEGRRVSIFNPSDGGQHPMRGVEVTNSTGLQLIPGPISVFDAGSYAGDAQIGHVGEGDKRLLAYAVDLDVSYTREENSHETTRRIKIVRGSFDFSIMRQSISRYTFNNKDDRPRTLIIEQPRHQGWTLAKPEKPYETTDSLYRFEQPIEAGKIAPFEVVQERIESRTIGLMQIDLPTLLTYARSGQVSEKVIDAFKEAARLQAVVGDLERQIAELEKSQRDIQTDQGRIRENMRGIDSQSALYSRYMTKLTEQETTLEGLQQSLASARQSLLAAQKAFNDYVADLSVE